MGGDLEAAALAGPFTSSLRHSSAPNHASNESALTNHSHSIHEEEEDEDEEQHGSSVAQAIFNFTNSIVGAGAIGLGGAIAVSGGLVSIACIVVFGWLTKCSLDLVIRLSVETPNAHGSYEDLAYVSMGSGGRWTIMVCKLLYSLGCLVAYIIVIKDNLSAALVHLIYGHHHTTGETSWCHDLLANRVWFTWCISLVFVLPLCLLRDMTPLASLSFVSVISMISIVGIVIYMWMVMEPNETPVDDDTNHDFYQHWIEIRPGILESLGTFVFTFVSQHTVHLVYGSLKPSVRTVQNWKTVSTWSILSATLVSLAVGVVVYMTFWLDTKSDIFEMYPPTPLIDIAKLLLCITMILTFPLPFFTSRELLIVIFVHPFCGLELAAHRNNNHQQDNEREQDGPQTVVCSEGNGGDNHSNNNNNQSADHNDLLEPLLSQEEDDEDDTNPITRGGLSDVLSDTASVISHMSRRVREPKHWLLDHDHKQLQLTQHVALTCKVWFIMTALAIAAPSLGDVLDLVGCATGTLIAFILPALLSFRIEGYSHLAMLIFCVGGVVGTVGTYFSIKKLFSDI